MCKNHTLTLKLEYIVGDLPYENMWKSDRLWLPRVLSGNVVVGRIVQTEQVTLGFNLTFTSYVLSLL